MTEEITCLAAGHLGAQKILVVRSQYQRGKEHINKKGAFLFKSIRAKVRAF